MKYPDHLLSTSDPSTATRPQQPVSTTREHDRPGDPHDEWGVYDPDFAGLPAILARIGAGLEPDDESSRQRQAKLLRLSADEDE